MITNRALLLLLLTAWTTTSARATTLVRLSLEQLGQASSVVVRGRVLSQRSQWTSDHRRIVTITPVAVSQTLKGSAVGTITIEQPGGSVDGVRSRVAGTVLFEPGAEYILFLEPSASKPACFLVVGMVQGAFPVIPVEADTRSRSKGPRNDAGEQVTLPLGTLLEGEPAAPVVMRDAMPLSRFLRELERALRRPLVIPRGTQISVVLLPGSQHGRTAARTVADIYPNSGIVIPAGSVVRGREEVASGEARIRWQEIDIRGRRVRISATSLHASDSSRAANLLVLTVG